MFRKVKGFLKNVLKCFKILNVLKNEDIGVAVEANDSIKEKLTRAQNEGVLTEKAEASAEEARQKNLRNIEKTLKNVSEKARERYIKNYDLEDLFESDGSLKRTVEDCTV